MDTDAGLWQRMRGTQMVATMKIISLGHDIDRKKIKHVPGFVEFWAYILCPGNVIMGPWVSFSDYKYIFVRRRWVKNQEKEHRIALKVKINIFLYFQSLKWAFHIFCNAMLAIIFLVLSNCMIGAYIPDFGFM